MPAAQDTKFPLSGAVSLPTELWSARVKPVLILAMLLAMPVVSALAQQPAPDSQLCRSQLKLLISGDKLTEEEAARFETQCLCLEARERGDSAAVQDSCAR